jgi:hypothetical protein
MLRGAGNTAECRPAVLRKALLPFEEPRTGTAELPENLGGRLPFIKEPERQTAIPNFVSIFSCHPQTIRPVK